MGERGWVGGEEAFGGSAGKVEVFVLSGAGPVCRVFNPAQFILLGGMSERLMQRAQLAPPGEALWVLHTNTCAACERPGLVCLQVAPTREGEPFPHKTIPVPSPRKAVCCTYVGTFSFVYSWPLLCASSLVAVTLS